MHGFGGGPMHSIWEQRHSLDYMKDGEKPGLETAKRLWRTLRPHRGKLFIVLGLTALGVILSLIPPLIIRAIIDRALAHHHLHLLFALASLLVIIPATRAIITVAQNYLNTVVAQGIIFDLRTALYNHAQDLGLDFFTHTMAGDIHSRLINDLNAVQRVLSRTLSGLFINVLTIVLTLGTMFYLNARLAIIALFILPAFAWPVMAYGQKSYRVITKAQRALSQLTAHLEETLTLSGILVVKSFGTKEREARQFRALSDAVRHTQIQQSLVGQWLGLVVQILSAFGPALLYGYGGYLVLTHQAELGTIVAFATYLGQLFTPASALAGANTTLIGGLAVFDRIFRFIDLKISVPEPLVSAPEPGPTPHSPVGLIFEHVSFSYPSLSPLSLDANTRASEQVLRDIHFEAPAGQLTALVGPSGAGKSTILALAARFYDPDEGHVLLGHHPLSQYREDVLRRVIAVVTQEVFLFHTTLEDNIRYGLPTASERDVQEAIEAAQLGDVVKSLPQGLKTIVGERGYRLSGGEKQRVAIARAILRNPRILLLDEATSSLDSHAERLIGEALVRLFQGRTVIAIAHRLSTILAADQILVINQGQIVERGTHHELLATNPQGLYAQLYHEQFDPQMPLSTAP